MYVSVNNINIECNATEMQQYLLFGMFVELKTFHKAHTSLVNHTA